MTDPKSVELTEAEQRALFTAFTEDSITALRDVIETAKADAWAAARREALLEAAADMEAEKALPFWSVHVAALRKRAAEEPS